MVSFMDELECDDRFRSGTTCLFPASASTATDRAAPTGTSCLADRYDASRAGTLSGTLEGRRVGSFMHESRRQWKDFGRQLESEFNLDGFRTGLHCDHIADVGLSGYL